MLLLPCAAKCIAGKYLNEITKWKGKGEDNGRARLRAKLGYPISARTMADHNEVRILECRALVQLELCQPEEIVIIQVRGEMVLGENRPERKGQSDRRKQEVKGVKRVVKNAHES